jgi:hypothetical protein
MRMARQRSSVWFVRRLLSQRRRRSFGPIQQLSTPSTQLALFRHSYHLEVREPLEHRVRQPHYQYYLKGKSDLKSHALNLALWDQGLRRWTLPWPMHERA